MSKNGRFLGSLGLTALVAACLVAQAPEARAADQLTDQDIQQLLEYSTANPGDFAGFDTLFFEFTGERTTTVVNGESYNDVEQAQAAYDAPTSAPSDVTAQAGNFPTDSIDVTFQWGAGPNLKVVMTGTWNWQNDFIGGASEPFDVASIQLDAQSCIRMENHSGSLRLPSGEETGVPVLRDAGVSTRAPIWNIPSRASGFENTGDHGNVFMSVDMAPCGHPIPMGGAFSYEGNQGGSIISVSASFAGLSVSYNNPGLTLQKATEPIYAG